MLSMLFRIVDIEKENEGCSDEDLRAHTTVVDGAACQDEKCSICLKEMVHGEEVRVHFSPFLSRDPQT